MPEPAVPQTPRRNPFFLILLLFWGFYLIWGAPGMNERREPVSYSEFLQAVNRGQIEQAAVGQTRIEGKFRAGPPGRAQHFSTVRIEDPNLLPALRASGVKFTGVDESGGPWAFLSAILPFLLLILFWSFLLRRGMGAAGKGGILSLGKSKAKVFVETDLKVRFDDVAGVDEAKEELREIVNFLKEPVRYSTLGGRMPKGVLLVGPPGTGKTMLARAVAGEAGVPFFSINGSEFVEMFVGLGAARVRDLFEQARSRAPCIIFIDELDALGKSRAAAAITGGNDEKEQTLNQLLAELDGFDPAKGVILVGATNRPEVLDPALLRAGRFDRSILVDRPDRSGRLQILRVHAKKIKIDPAVNLEQLAGMTAGFSGADLANLVNEAALVGTRRSAQAVEFADFTAAIERIVAGLEKKSRLLNANEKKRVAYHEMGHATVGLALGQQEIVHKVSIIPRGIGALGYTMSRPTEDRYLMERAELENKIAVLLGGRAAEIEFFDDISTGAADDLDKASEIARAMITRYGMSEQLGLSILERDTSPMLGGRYPMKSFEYSEKTAQEIDREIRRILDKGLESARALVNRYRAMIDEAAQLLMKQESLDEQTIKRLWDKYQSRFAIAR